MPIHSVAHTQVDSTHYPNWTLLVSQLQSKGIKVLTYINCMLSDVSHRGTPYKHNYFKEAIQEGYFVRNADGSMWTGYSNSSMVDLTNPKAYQWMVDIIVNVGSLIKCRLLYYIYT